MSLPQPEIEVTAPDRPSWRRPSSTLGRRVALGIALALVAAELLLRVLSAIFYPRLIVSDSEIGWRYLPSKNVERRFSAQIKYRLQTNSLGFRDDEFSTDPGIKRFMILGDSMTFGMEADQTDLFTAVVEKEIRASEPVDIMNFGVTGFGTAQELFLLRKFGPVYSPRAVVLMFFEGNDFEDNVDIMTASRFRPHLDLQGDNLVPHLQGTLGQKVAGFFKDHCLLYLVFDNAFRPFTSAHTTDPDIKLKTTLRLLEEMQREARVQKAPLSVVYLRLGEDRGRLEALRQKVGELGVSLIDVYLPANELVGGSGHLNPAGHRHVSRELRRAIGL